VVDGHCWHGSPRVAFVRPYSPVSAQALEALGLSEWGGPVSPR
jgi:hypothetical protein